jgi:hypothetical protein
MNPQGGEETGRFLFFLSVLPASLFIFSLLHATAGCGPSAEKQETDALLHAADALRDAPSEPLAARQALLDALVRQAAPGALATDARDACVQAYRLLLDASAVEARVRKQLEEPAEAGAAALSDVADLASAEAKLKESAAVMPRCDAALAELRRARRAR